MMYDILFGPQPNLVTGVAICLVVFGLFYWLIGQHIVYQVQQERFYRAHESTARMKGESDRDYVERLLGALRGVRFEEYNHPIAEQILNVRRRAAGNFTPEYSGNRGEAYDNAVLDVYRELEAYLTGEPKRDRYGKVEEVA